MTGRSLLLPALVLLLSGAPTAMADINDWQWLSDRHARRRPPFRIFDNVSYVGLDWVSCYVIETRDGLVLIDALYPPFTDILLENLRQLDLDPEAIGWVVVTHGHWDHAAGARALQQRFGARVVMSAADWDLIAEQPGPGPTGFTPADEDLVLDDGETLTAGETTFTFHLTPGHTLGTLSVEFPVRDGDRTWRALTYGGVGLNFTGAQRLQSYMESVRRIRQRGPFHVNLANHPGMGKLFQRADQLRQRAPGAPHPFVDEAALSAWLQTRLQAAAEALNTQESGRPAVPAPDTSTGEKGSGPWPGRLR